MKDYLNYSRIKLGAISFAWLFRSVFLAVSFVIPSWKKHLSAYESGSSRMAALIIGLASGTVLEAFMVLSFALAAHGDSNRLLNQLPTLLMIYPCLISTGWLALIMSASYERESGNF